MVKKKVRKPDFVMSIRFLRGVVIYRASETVFMILDLFRGKEMKMQEGGMQGW